jgi:hypothetical protein
MIRFVFRLVGFFLLVGAFVALVLDGAQSIAASQLRLTPLGQTWNDWHSTSLQLLQPAIERHVADWLWDPVMLNVLTTPTFVVLGALGAIFLLIGRKKKPLIGYARD